MHNPPPSTPQRNRSSAANSRSPLARQATPPSYSYPLTAHSQSSALATQLQTLSITHPALQNLPISPTYRNSSVAPDWLPEYAITSYGPEADVVLPALIASRASLAVRHREHRWQSREFGIAWDWYIKEISRCKMMYKDVTDVIIGLCSFLELTTDAPVLFYCASAERSPNDTSVGRNEVIYHNCRITQSENGAGYINDIINAARRFGDHLTSQWISRQNAYDRHVSQTIASAAATGRRVHRFGDFPLYARFDADAAHALIKATVNIDWQSAGFDVPTFSISLASSDNAPSPPRPSIRIPDRPSSMSGSVSSTTFSEPAETECEDPFKISHSPPSFTGRRARPSEVECMQRLGLTDLQKAQIRLVLWEIEPDRWYSALLPVIGRRSE
ncbi:hypothetical protein FRB90_000702, partial [Tulasnella sp. 427]